MKKFFSILVLSVIALLPAFGQVPASVKPVKNVIVMLSDGTSTSVISAARWYKTYNKMGNNLYIDPYLCGSVSTYCSNRPIGDSAPTMSCYMTGVSGQAGNISIYPTVDPENDLVPLDKAQTYQPLATVLEAARILQNKSTGLVVTCEFPHATPAACASHCFSRSNYKYIAPQMAYNNLDVMIGGGNDFVSDDMKAHFKNSGTTLIQDNLTAFRNFKGNDKLWALFDKTDMPYDLDRDPEKTPSIEEMTRKAIELLSKNKNGFFLMVEGSKVDWAAHANDAVGAITEFIAFDNAVGAALEFAQKNGETAIIILADHSTGGLSIGRQDFRGNTLKELFGVVSQYKKTAAGVEDILKATQPDQIKNVFAKYTGLELKDEDYNSIVQSRDYPFRETNASNSNRSLSSNIIRIMNAPTCFGFTTGNHTGEEVFLAVYHPKGNRPTGFVSNIQINDYLCKASGFKTSLPELSKKLFAKHTDVLAGLKYEIDASSDFPTLTVEKGNNKLQVKAQSSTALINGKPISLNSVVVYVNENKTFYLPKDILSKLN